MAQSSDKLDVNKEYFTSI